MKNLNKWSIVANKDPYCPPEDKGACLHGTLDSGKVIRTSSILEIDKENQIVTTYSGSNYKLIDPDPKYIEYCESIGKSPQL